MPANAADEAISHLLTLITMRKAGIARGLSAVTPLAVAAVLLIGGPARAAGAAVGSVAARSTVSAAPRQLITVTAASYRTTYATLRAYRMSGGKWVEVFGPWTCLLYTSPSPRD